MLDSLLNIKTRVVEKTLGWVVDFCPICREPRICRFSRFSEVRHWNFIPTGPGTPLEEQIKCTRCNTRQAVDPTRYHAVLPKPPKDVASAAVATMPNLQTLLYGRMELEKRVQENLRQLSPDERRFLLFEPFELLNWNFERNITSGHFDKQGGIGCIGTLVLGALAIPVLIYTPQASQQHAQIFIAALLGFGLLYTLVQMALSVGRLMRQTIFPNLVRALKPLHPDGQELHAILQRCELHDFKLAEQLKVPKLLEALR